MKKTLFLVRRLREGVAFLQLLREREPAR